MERAPKQEVSQVENNSEWKDLREQAVSEAATLIEQVEGFTEMDAGEQVSVLQDVIENLSAANENRFIAKEVANKIPVLAEEARHAEEMVKLGVVA